MAYFDRSLRLSCVAVMAAGLLSLAAVPVRAADRDRIEAFLSVTGFDVALDSIALSAADAPAMLGIDAGAFGQEWTTLTEEVFDVDTMHALAVDILEHTLTDEALAHAADFYASDLGQRLVEVENAAHLDQDSEAKQIGGAELIGEMMEEGSPRLEYFKRMQTAIDSDDVAVRALQMIQMRFLLSASAAGVIELRVDADELQAMMDAQSGELRRAIKQSSLASSAWVYRDFSDADVLAYTEALEEPLMREVYTLLNAVQYEITANRFEVLAQRMGTLQPEQDI